MVSPPAEVETGLREGHFSGMLSFVFCCTLFCCSLFLVLIIVAIILKSFMYCIEIKCHFCIPGVMNVVLSQLYMHYFHKAPWGDNCLLF